MRFWSLFAVFEASQGGLSPLQVENAEIIQIIVLFKLVGEAEAVVLLQIASELGQGKIRVAL